MKKIYAVVAAMMLALGVFAAPAQAATKPSDFYYSKNCSIYNKGGLKIGHFKYTNYDAPGGKQTYHYVITMYGSRNPVVILDTNKGWFYTAEDFITLSDRNSHVLRGQVEDSARPYGAFGCSITG